MARWIWVFKSLDGYFLLNYHRIRNIGELNGGWCKEQRQEKKS